MKKILTIAFLTILTVLPFCVQGQLLGKKIRKAIYEDDLYKQFREVKLTLTANGDLYDWGQAKTDPQMEKVDGVLVDFFRSVLEDPTAKNISISVLTELQLTCASITTRYNNLITQIQADIQTKVIFFKDFQNLPYEYYTQELKSILEDLAKFTERLRATYNKGFINSVLVVGILKIVAKEIEKLAVRSVKRILIEELNHLRIPPLDWTPVFEAVQSKKPVSGPSVEVEMLTEVSNDATNAMILRVADVKTLTPALVEENYIREKTRLESLLSEGDLAVDEGDYFKEKLEKLESAKLWFDSHPPSSTITRDPSADCEIDVLVHKLEALLDINKTKGCIPVEQLEAVLINYR